MPGIYIASKTKHGRSWAYARDLGTPINSTWIDEAGAGQTSDWQDLWERCVREASTADALVVFREGDEILKGAWVEVGAALASEVPVYAVGIEEFSVSRAKGIVNCSSFTDAVNRALQHVK